MDVNKMLAELRQEREQIEEAIIILETARAGKGKAARYGRRCGWLKPLRRQNGGVVRREVRTNRRKKSGRRLRTKGTGAG